MEGGNKDMSSEVESRIVQMKFDNKNFENNVQTTMSSLDKLKKLLKFDGADKSFEKISDSAKKVNLSGIGDAAEAVKMKFSALEVVALTTLVNITNKAIDAGSKMIKALTLDPIMQGFAEYETQIGAVQTILANTSHQGTNLQQVNAALDQLNTYADKTIYNFTEMTRNIGTFTAAGIDLNTSVDSIKGIANLAAVSGSTSQQASTAMYQLSQALAAGKVQLMDWNSVVNAGMGGKVFQDALIRTSELLKTGAKDAIAASGSFRESLTKSGWLTKEVLTETLKQFSGAYDAAELKAQGFTDSQVKEILKMADTAEQAATKVKTFTQLWDTLKESAQSGWTQSWEIIVGDFEEAKETLTYISNAVGDIIGKTAEARNKVLDEGLSTGYKQFLSAGIDDEAQFIAAFHDTVEKSFLDLEDEIGFGAAISKSLNNGTISVENFKDALNNMAKEYKGLSDAELKEAGISRDTIERFNTLKKGVDEGSISLDEFIKKMKMPSGRQNIFNGFFNIAKSLVAVLTPVKEAFREIFPAMTGEQLYKLTEGFRNFTEKLIISGETSAKLKTTFKGLFSILDILWDAFKVGLNVVKSFVRLLPGMGGGLLGITSSFGSWSIKLHDSIEQSKIFQNVSNGMVSVIDAIPEKLKGTSKAFDILNIAVEKVKGVFRKLGELAAPAVEGIGKAFNNINMESLGTLFAGGFFLSIGKNFKKTTDNILGSFNNLSDNLTGSVESITGLLDGVRTSLEAYQQNLKANTMKTIAIAIGILAASLFLLSTIDPKRISTALTAISTEFLALMVSLETFNKIMNGKSSKNMIKTASYLIGLSVAVLILSSAVEKMSKLDWNELIIGLGGLAGTMVILSKTTEVMGHSNGKMLKGAGNLILLSVAINILANAVSKMSTLRPDELIKGLSGVGVLCAGLATFMKITDLNGMGLLKGAGLILLTQSINMLSNAVGKFSEMDTNKMVQGLSGVGAVLAGLAIFTKITSGSSGMITTSAGMILLAQAMVIFSNAVDKMGTIEQDKMIQGLLGLAGALTMCTVAIKLLPTNTLIVAAGMIVMAQSLKMVGEAVNSVKDMTMEQIGKSMLALAGGLTALVIAANAMNGALPGAAAMLIMAGALNMITPPLKTLGSMTLTQIGLSLITLAGAFTVISVAAALLTPVIPSMIALAGAITLLGIGTAGIGVGILALSTGLTALSVSGAAGVGALVSALKSLIGLIPFILESVGRGIVAIIKTIGDSASIIAQSFTAIVSAILSTLSQSFPQFITFIQQLLNEIVANAPGFIDAGMKLIKAFLTGVRDNVGEIVTLVIDTIIEVINSITEQIPKITQAGIDLVIGLIDGLAQGIEDNAPRIRDAFVHLFDSLVEAILVFLGIHSPSTKFIEIAKQVIDGFIKGIKDFGNNSVETIKQWVSDMISSIRNKMGEFLAKGREIMTNLKNGISKAASNVKNAAIKVITDSLSALSDKIRDFVSIGKNMINGMKEGIQNAARNVVDAAKGIANDAIQGAKKILKIHSPSKVFTEIGENVGKGFVKGLKYGNSEVYNASTKLGEKAIDGTITALDDNNYGFEDQGELMMDTLDNGIDTTGGKVVKSVDAVSKSSLDTLEDSQSDYYDSGAESMYNVSYGMDSKSSEVSRSTGNIINDSLSTIDNSMSEFTDKGTQMIQSVAEGIDNGSSVVQDAVKRAIDNALSENQSTSDSYRSSYNFEDEKPYVEATEPAPIWFPEDNARIDDNFKTLDKFIDERNDRVEALEPAPIWFDRDYERTGFDNFKKVGTAIMDGLSNGMKSDNKAISAMSTMASNVIGTAKNIFGIHSPSRVFTQIGEYVGKGFVNGLENLYSSAEQASELMGTTAMEGISSVLGNISNAVSDTIETNPVIRPILDLSDVNRGTDFISRTLNGERMLNFGLAGSINSAGYISGKLAGQNEIKEVQEVVVNNDDVISEVQTLRQDVQSLRDVIGNMRIYLDTGRLVGGITRPIDNNLGKQTILRERGVASNG